MGVSRNADPGNRVLVVGAGVFGLGAAVELRRRGRDVVVVDPGPVPHPEASSTDISKAVRVDYGADDLYTELAERSIESWERWNADWEQPLYHQHGFLLLSPQELRPGTFEGDSHEMLTGRGYRLMSLEGEALAERFPPWRASRYRHGYFNPRGGWAESGRVVGRLRDRAQAAGAEIRPGVAFDRLHEDGSRVAGIVAKNGDMIPARTVILAAGAWTPTLLPWLQDRMWASGHPVLHFQPKRSRDYLPDRFPVWAADISNTGWYGFPLYRDGILKVANHGPGRRVHPGEPRDVAAGEEERFRQFLSRHLPDVAAAPVIGRRLCLYCDTFDGDLWVDRDPEREGLVVAAGGSGHGFKFAPLLGQIIADVVDGVPGPWTERFAWRDLGPRNTEHARFNG